MQEQISSLVNVATPRQLGLLKALVIDLVSMEVIGQDTVLVASVGLKNLGSLTALVPTLPPPTPESLSLLLTSSSDKVQALNSALQLITSIKPNQVQYTLVLLNFILCILCRCYIILYCSVCHVWFQVSLLASGFGLRSARKVSTRWCFGCIFE